MNTYIPNNAIKQAQASVKRLCDLTGRKIELRLYYEGDGVSSAQLFEDYDDHKPCSPEFTHGKPLLAWIEAWAEGWQSGKKSEQKRSYVLTRHNAQAPWVGFVRDDGVLRRVESVVSAMTFEVAVYALASEALADGCDEFTISVREGCEDGRRNDQRIESSSSDAGTARSSVAMSGDAGSRRHDARED